jgi:two-component system chemotaxis sensor kinase CheA
VSAIAETLRYRPQRSETVARQPVLRLRGEMLPLLDMREFFHLAADDAPSPEYVVVARWGDRALALGVDDLMGQHEVVIKPIGRRLEKVPGLAGATELGENRAALVVDMTSLAAEALGAGTA